MQLIFCSCSVDIWCVFTADEFAAVANFNCFLKISFWEEERWEDPISTINALQVWELLETREIGDDFSWHQTISIVH